MQETPVRVQCARTIATVAAVRVGVAVLSGLTTWYLRRRWEPVGSGRR